MRKNFLAVVAGVLVLSTAVALRASTNGLQKTTNDAVYTKVQADGAKAQYDKICAECHAFTVAAKKQAADLPLGDEPFLKKWEGKSLDELVSVIVLTMPNDGSAVVSDAEALNLVAYILQQNGMPAGATPLTKETATAVLARPKK
jgi:mono/diheme cytochrome c family protein